MAAPDTLRYAKIPSPTDLVQFLPSECAAAQTLIQPLEERWPRCFAVYERRRRPLKGRNPW